MLLLFFTSCAKEKKEVVEVAFNPDSTFTMQTTDVVSFISDSGGYTRYRIVSKEVLMFDKAKEPYWYFPEKLYIERFDTLLQVEASAQADTVYRWLKKDLWKLVGNVELMNMEGERFETSLLYWDQKAGRFYSDAYIRITRTDRILTGVGFESNENISKFRIIHPQISIPIKESTHSDSTRRVQEGTERPVFSPPLRSRPVAVQEKEVESIKMLSE